MLHRLYLKQTNPELFNDLLLNGKLCEYLSMINAQADESYRNIIKLLKEQRGITDDLRIRSKQDWISAMNSIVSEAEDTIKKEYIYRTDYMR